MMLNSKDLQFKTYDQMFNDLVKIGPTAFPFCRDSDGIWRRLEAKWVLDWLVDEERYEDCQILKDLMEGNWEASDNRQCHLEEMLFSRGYNVLFNEYNY